MLTWLAKNKRQWLLKISKVSKLVKIGKVVKTGKIIRKSSAISKWLKVIAMNAAVLLFSDGVGLPAALGQLLIVSTAVLATTIKTTKR